MKSSGNTNRGIGVQGLDPERRPTINICDAAQLLGISKSTAYEAANAGQIPTILVGKRRRVVPTAALMALLGIEVTYDNPTT